MHRPDFSALFGLNAAYAEKVYAEYLADSGTVSPEWRHYFDAQLPPELRAAAVAVAAAVESAEPPATEPPSAEPPAAESPLPAPATHAEPPARAGAEPMGGAEQLVPLAGVAGRIVRNMVESLGVPTATSTREVPVKVLEENRHAINRHQQGLYLPKVSFTHLIAWALVQAVQRVPAMAGRFVEQDGKPHRAFSESLNLGIAIDLPGKDGRRSLVVPNVKDCKALDFAGFFAAYNAQVDKARRGALQPADFAATTCTLTNPGTIGTQSSLPRLLAGQSFILATGAIAVPGAFQGASPETLTELGVSRVMTLTSTYDHRVIQGAESGAFLDWLYRLLLGEEGFYEGVFRSLAVPYRPIKSAVDRRPPLGSTLREAENLERAAGLMTYIRSYRVRGHALADLDPLRFAPNDLPELDMSTYGLTLWDKERTFYSDGVTEKPFATLREIQEVLHLTYCRHIGVEFMHIADQEQRLWLRTRMESTRNEEPLPRELQLGILDRLVEAEAFEQFLHTRFVGHKRFSLEGGDTLVPVLHALLDRAAEHGAERMVLGMAHRGRLNVLAHLLQKPLVKIFGEFEGWLDPAMAQGSGDVKYHLGAEAEVTTASGQVVRVELACNPSHLEAVAPVVEGMARARQEALPQPQGGKSDGAGKGDGAGKADRGAAPSARVLPVLVHGDAAFAGQGVVFETLQMSQLHGYRTGGTVHIVVNNQIGYTTSPQDSRSTPFCTDVAKAIQAPIFHVNGDDPLAAVRMIRLAMDYRARFHRDVVVDIVCYRRHGHNEGDEPSFTQPLLYRQIETHPTVRTRYQEYLLRAAVLRPDDLAGYDAKVQQRLKQSLDEVRATEPPPVVLPGETADVEWQPSPPPVPLAELQRLQDRQLDWPADFHAHPKAKAILERRRDMLHGKAPVDFATAEALAFASLLTTGVPVRLAGQDSGRGTFSQRHAALYDAQNGRRHVPLNHLQPDQARFTVVDSLLSEEAALGFEYGYSTAVPHGLTLWEAQFGDFVNGAQIQIDQFLAAGEAKWAQASGLTLLLPHGFDGQGPEHSSARLERFLQLCAENNLRVANPSCAASYFQLLRAQALDPQQKPLVVMTPKSLLRQKEAGSTSQELAAGGFLPVRDDPTVSHTAAAQVERVVCCSGKVYYDLLAARPAGQPLALVRLELLYPFPATQLAALRARYPRAAFVWCQEEPANMGAWSFLRDRFPWAASATRRAAASPATGSSAKHKSEQAALIAAALRLP